MACDFAELQSAFMAGNYKWRKICSAFGEMVTEYITF
jgi:hypothetical protein